MDNAAATNGAHGDNIGGISDRYIRWRELKEIVPICRSRVAELETLGKFPKRRKIGGFAVAWLESEIIEWMASREVVS